MGLNVGLVTKNCNNQGFGDYFQKENQGNISAKLRKLLEKNIEKSWETKKKTHDLQFGLRFGVDDGYLGQIHWRLAYLKWLFRSSHWNQNKPYQRTNDQRPVVSSPLKAM